MNTTTICIGENRRKFCREKYSNCGKQIHEILVRSLSRWLIELLVQIFLLQVNSTPNESLFIGILKCFASWICIESFDEQLLLSSPLLNTVLEVLVGRLSSRLCSNLLFVRRNPRNVPTNFTRALVIVFAICWSCAK